MRRAEEAQARGDRKEIVRQVLAARSALEKAIRAKPTDYKSRVLLGQVLFSLGLREKAREQLETALSIRSEGPIADTARAYLRRIGKGHSPSPLSP